MLIGRQVAEGIISAMKKAKILAGKNPMGMAAAVLYLASREREEKLIQMALAEISEVSVVTVRSGYRELEKVMETGTMQGQSPFEPSGGDTGQPSKGPHEDTFTQGGPTHRTGFLT